MRDCRLTHIGLLGHRIWRSRGRHVEPQSRFQMNRGMRRAIDDALQIADAVKIEVGLGRPPVWDVPTDIGDFQDLLCGIELKEKRIVVLFVRASYEIETGPNKGSRQVPQKAEILLDRIQRTAGTKN